MSEAIQADQKTEVTKTTQDRVTCDGPADGRHPRVFLNIDPKTGYVTCPYCSHVFKKV